MFFPVNNLKRKHTNGHYVNTTITEKHRKSQKKAQKEDYWNLETLRLVTGTHKSNKGQNPQSQESLQNTENIDLILQA